ncbi:MAG: RDD family protein [Nannocystaceae bacterium]|nr:RDD family protein [Nannocystaceae bacterium]
MAPRRPRPPKPSFCPVCDATLGAEVAAGAEPSCPVCRVPLVPMRAAGLWRRFAASMVDAVILLFTAGPLAWLLASMSDEPPLLGGKTALEALLRLFELEPGALVRKAAPLAVMAVLYLALFWHLSGRTPGQSLLKIRVVDRNARRPGVVRTLIRAVVTVVGLVPGGLGWLWALVDMERRSWHDWLAGTHAVRDP